MYGDQVITIEKNTITATTSTNIVMSCKLSHNCSHVVKFNKNSISTYNNEFLCAAMEHDKKIFDNIYNYIVFYALRDMFTPDSVTVSQFYNSFNNCVSDFIEFFKACSPETRQTIIYDHICFNHDAKMRGVISLSTYVGYNAFCVARCNNCPGAICEYCYANSLTKQRFFLKMKLIRIMAIFTNIELQPDDIPVLDSELYPFFRFEGFGDLNNTLQFANYNLFARVNSGVNCTIWTKNPGIIQAAINAGLLLSNNLIIGLSSLYLNTPEIDKAKKYSFIRFLFTVYDDDYIKEHNIVINCGARHCLTCGICYKYLHEYKNGLYIINERKK